MGPKLPLIAFFLKKVIRGGNQSLPLLSHKCCQPFSTLTTCVKSNTRFDLLCSFSLRPAIAAVCWSGDLAIWRDHCQIAFDYLDLGFLLRLFFTFWSFHPYTHAAPQPRALSRQTDIVCDGVCVLSGVSDAMYRTIFCIGYFNIFVVLKRISQFSPSFRPLWK